MTVNNLETKKLQLLQYLPELYREQGPGKEFLERFLGIFEKVLNDLDETISGIPGYFNPGTAPDDFLKFLAQWVCLDFYDLLKEKNREFILDAFEFYQKKGTAEGLAKLAETLTGRTCRVKEITNNIFYSWGMESAGGPGIVPGCTTMSKTVDTSDPVLLSKMRTHQDEVNYVRTTGETGLYRLNVIGLYIFLSKGEHSLNITEEQLRKIIAAFLPVLVRVEIIMVKKAGKKQVIIRRKEES